MEKKQMANVKDIIFKSMNHPEIKWNVTKNIMYKKESLSFDDLPEEVIRIIKTIKRNIESTEYIPRLFKTIKLQNIKDYLIKTDRDTFYNSKVNAFKLNNLNQKEDYEHFFYKCINRLKPDNKFKYSKENKKLISIEDLIKYSNNENEKNKKQEEKIIEDNHKWLKENNIELYKRFIIKSDIIKQLYRQVRIERINKKTIKIKSYHFWQNPDDFIPITNKEFYTNESGRTFTIYKFSQYDSLSMGEENIPIEEFKKRLVKEDFEIFNLEAEDYVAGIRKYNYKVKVVKNYDDLNPIKESDLKEIEEHLIFEWNDAPMIH